MTENANEGIDLVNSSLATYTLGNNIENGRVLSASTSNLSGNSLNNTIYAGSGNNLLNGLSGIDTVDYLYSTAGVTVTLASNDSQATGGSGTDYVRNFENINGTAFNDVLSGNALDNVLNGRGGSDTMSGGAGNDTYYVDIFNGVNGTGDQVIELANEGVDTVIFATHTGQLSTYTLGSNVENLVVATSDTVYLTGNAGDNIFSMGNRPFTPDRINGGAGSDTLDYSGATQNLRAFIDTTTNSMGWVKTGGSGSIYEDNGIDLDNFIYSIENFIGSNFDDSIAFISSVNDDNANNTLTGGKGNDYLQGNIGNDTYIFNRGDGSDTIQETGAKSISDDLLKFDSTISSKQLWFKQSNNDLDIQIIGTTDRIKISGWYNSSESQIETFKTSDNKSLS